MLNGDEMIDGIDVVAMDGANTDDEETDAKIRVNGDNPQEDQVEIQTVTEAAVMMNSEEMTECPIAENITATKMTAVQRATHAL